MNTPILKATKVKNYEFYNNGEYELMETSK
jgi:hypothetical protein